MSNNIPMNVWPSRPVPVKPADWRTALRGKQLARLSYREVCELAGVPAGVSGPDLERRIHVLRRLPHVYPVGQPDELGVALPGYRGTPADALRILETLAYGFFDYAAREAVRERGLFTAAPRPGRKRTGKALSGAERMRRLRRNAGRRPVRLPRRVNPDTR